MCVIWLLPARQAFRPAHEAPHRHQSNSFTPTAHTLLPLSPFHLTHTHTLHAAMWYQTGAERGAGLHSFLTSLVAGGGALRYPNPRFSPLLSFSSSVPSSTSPSSHFFWSSPTFPSSCGPGCCSCQMSWLPPFSPPSLPLSLAPSQSISTSLSLPPFLTRTAAGNFFFFFSCSRTSTTHSRVFSSSLLKFLSVENSRSYFSF